MSLTSFVITSQIPSQAMTKNSQSEVTSRTSTSGYAVFHLEIQTKEKKCYQENILRVTNIFETRKLNSRLKAFMAVEF